MDSRDGGNGVRILWVADEKAEDWGVQRVVDVKSGGPWVVVRSPSVFDALDKLTEHPFDVVLWDLGPAAGSGFDAFRRVLAKTGRLPLIVLGVAEDLDSAREAIRLGAQEFLPKPLMTPQLLGRTILCAMERNQQRRVLRRNGEKYRSALDNLADAYYEVDLSGNFIYVNKRLCWLRGWTRDQMVGRNYRECTTPAGAKRMQEIGAETIRTGASRAFYDFDAVTPDGVTAVFEISLGLMRDAEGNPIGFNGVARDVTEKRKELAALKDSEKRYRNIVANIEEGYFEADLKGRMTFFNEPMARLVKRSRAELLMVDNHGYLDGNNAKKVLRAYNEILTTGRPNGSLQYEVTRKDGTRCTLESSVSLMVDAQGRPKGFQGVVRDITERKNAEKALALARERAEASDRAKSQFLAYMSYDIRLPMNGIIGMYHLLMNTELTPEQHDYVQTVKRSADGLLSIVNNILDFFSVETGHLELATIDFDLRQTIENMVGLPAFQAHAKGLSFAYDIHSEVPSLLRGDPGRLQQIINNAVINAIKFTRRGEVVFRVVPVEETTGDVTLRFSIHDTGIGLSKADQKRLFTPFQLMDIAALRKYGGTDLGLTISRKLIQLMGGQMGIQSDAEQGATFWFTLRFEKQEGIQPRPMNDPEMLRGKRVLIVDDHRSNLDILGGYLKAWGCVCDQASSGSVALSLLHAVANAGAPYDLVISDLMMPEMDGAELARRIKADPSLIDTPLIMLTSHGLSGEVADMKSIGHAAHLTKPVQPSALFDCMVTVFCGGRGGTEAAVKHHEAIGQCLPEATRRDTRILVAEDNAINRRVALHLLQRCGFQADAVANGLEALAALESRTYDVVLMDVQMPEMDGLEATWAIRDPNSAVRNHGVPIIAMTAMAMQGDQDRCLQAGMDDFIAKPIQPVVLVKAIEKQLVGRYAIPLTG